MKIYTKTGDDGTTGLFNGQRVSKSHLRVESYGTIDELNSIIGIALSFSKYEILNKDLEIISNLLFNLGTDLATPIEPPPKFEVTRLNPKSITFLENRIDEYEKHLQPLKNFILPGGSKVSAFLHQARTVCRRAERLVVRLGAEDKISNDTIIFINRLSDYLFVASRFANYLEKIEDKIWNKDIEI